MLPEALALNVNPAQFLASRKIGAGNDADARCKEKNTNKLCFFLPGTEVIPERALAQSVTARHAKLGLELRRRNHRLCSHLLSETFVAASVELHVVP